MAISVVIRSKNSGSTLEESLKSIFNQSLFVDEVIVVDSGSTDNTLEIAKKYDCKIILYPTDIPFNYSKALNIGIEQSKGNHLFIISSHVVLVNKFSLAYMFDLLNKNKSIGVVSSYSSMDKGYENSIATLNDVKWEVVTLRNFKGVAMFNHCSLIEKSRWKEYPFDEQVPTAEDQDWCYYFMSKYNLGALTIYDPLIKYINPYFNTKKHQQEMLTIGRLLYPKMISTIKMLKLFTIHSLLALIKLDFQKIFYNYRFGYLILREKLGFGIKVSPKYNKRMHTEIKQ